MIQYVGQTSKRIKDRFAGHFGDIKRDVTDKPVPSHFNSTGHKGISDMSIYVLEYIKKPALSKQAQNIRLKRETNWVHVLRTMSPHGLNWENPKEFQIKKN